MQNLIRYIKTQNIAAVLDFLCIFLRTQNVTTINWTSVLSAAAPKKNFWNGGAVVFYFFVLNFQRGVEAEDPRREHA